jgi:hypothetical protein
LIGCPRDGAIAFGLGRVPRGRLDRSKDRVRPPGVSTYRVRLFRVKTGWQSSVHLEDSGSEGRSSLRKVVDVTFAHPSTELKRAIAIGPTCIERGGDVPAIVDELPQNRQACQFEIVILAVQMPRFTLRRDPPA